MKHLIFPKLLILVVIIIALQLTTFAFAQNYIEDGESCHRSSGSLCCSGTCNSVTAGSAFGECQTSSGRGSQPPSRPKLGNGGGDEVNKFFDNVLPKVKEIADSNNNGNNGSTSQILLTIFGTIMVILLIGLIIIGVWYFRRRKRLSSREVQEFRNGNPVRVIGSAAVEEGAAVTHEEFTKYLPFNTAVDLPASKLDFTTAQLIGEGEFGFVTKAAINSSAVAVKAVKPNTDNTNNNSFFSEPI